jgi:hypothetical protein
VIVWDEFGGAKRIWEEKLIIRQMAISRDGTVLAVQIASRSEVRVYEVSTHRMTNHARWYGDEFITIALSADGTELLTNVSFGKEQVVLWKDSFMKRNYTRHD